MKRSNHLSQPVYIPGILQDDTVLFARRRYGFYGPLEGMLDDERDANERDTKRLSCSSIRILRDSLRSFVTRDRYLLDSSREPKSVGIEYNHVFHHVQDKIADTSKNANDSCCLKVIVIGRISLARIIFIIQVSD